MAAALPGRRRYRRIVSLPWIVEVLTLARPPFGLIPWRAVIVMGATSASSSLHWGARGASSSAFARRRVAWRSLPGLRSAVVGLTPLALLPLRRRPVPVTRAVSPRHVTVPFVVFVAYAGRATVASVRQGLSPPSSVVALSGWPGPPRAVVSIAWPARHASQSPDTIPASRRPLVRARLASTT